MPAVAPAGATAQDAAATEEEPDFLEPDPDDSPDPDDEPPSDDEPPDDEPPSDEDDEDDDDEDDDELSAGLDSPALLEAVLEPERLSVL